MSIRSLARAPAGLIMATCRSRSRRLTFDSIGSDNRERVPRSRDTLERGTTRGWGERGIDRKEKQERESRLAIGKRRKRRFPPVLSDSRWKRCLVVALHLGASPFSPLARGLRRVVGNKSVLWMLMPNSYFAGDTFRWKMSKLKCALKYVSTSCGINAESVVYQRLSARELCLSSYIYLDDCEKVCNVRIRIPFSGKCR